MMVDQSQYVCVTNRKIWVQEPSVYFSTGNILGVRLSDAAAGKVENVDDEGEFPLDVDSTTITIRMSVGS